MMKNHEADIYKHARVCYKSETKSHFHQEVHLFLPGCFVETSSQLQPRLDRFDRVLDLTLFPVVGPRRFQLHQ